MGEVGTVPAVSPNNSGNESSNKTNKDNANVANMNKNTNKKNKNGSNPKSYGSRYQNFKGKTEDTNSDIFYYRKGMNAKYVTSKEALLNWICTKYSASEETFIKSRSIIIIGMTKLI